MASKRSQPRSLYGTAKAHGHSQAQEARLALAEARQGHEARHGAEEAEGDVIEFENGSRIEGVPRESTLHGEGMSLVYTDAALKRLVTEPGETWVLETEQAEDVAMAALGTWAAARGVFVIVFGKGERFGCLTTHPGDTIILYTARPDLLNQQVLASWAQSRGLALAVLPPDLNVQQLDDATLDQMGLMRKPAGLIIPTGVQLRGPQNGSPG